MNWKEWVTGATTEYIYGTHLNGNFDYLSTLMAAGITGGNFAANAINSGNFIAADVVNDSHLNYAATAGAARVMQIGKKAGAYQQFYCKGTSLITAANVMYTDITITYANGDICAAGEPVFAVVPHVKAWAYGYGAASAGPHMVDVTTAGTLTANVRYNCYDTETIAANVVIYWELCGNI